MVGGYSLCGPGDTITTLNLPLSSPLCLVCFVCTNVFSCRLANQQSQTPPASPTLKKWISLALNVTDYGLDALKDVSFLPGRDSKHPDRKSLDFKRVTLKLVCREEFQKMNKWEQAVYVYRLAK